MFRIEIKPLSVNQVWQGKRFKTPKYKSYETEMFYKLPVLTIPKGIKLELHIHVGFSSKGSDLDNVCKPFQDIISKKYGFNDNQIYKLIMTKEIIPKNKEFISFNIMEYVF